MSKKSGFTTRCCLCTRDASGFHWHQRYDGPEVRTRGPERATLVGEGVIVRPSTLGPKAGNGLFAQIPFASRDVITEYDGVRLRSKAEAMAQRTQTHIAQKDGTYVSGLREPIQGRGGGSFANDKPGAYNAELWNAGPERGNRLYIRVKSGHVIRPGDEIFMSYGTGRAVAMGDRRLDRATQNARDRG